MPALKAGAADDRAALLRLKDQGLHPPSVPRSPPLPPLNPAFLSSLPFFPPFDASPSLYPSSPRRALSLASSTGSFLFTSSSAVYDVSDNGPCTEVRRASPQCTDWRDL